MAKVFSGIRARAGAHAGDRRALQCPAGEGPRSVPAVRSAGRLLAARLLRARHARGLCQAAEHSARAAGHGPAEAFAGRLRAAPVARDRHHPADAVRRLLPHRVGLHPLRQGAQHSRRPGPRIGRRIAAWPTRSASPTSIRCRTSCCSSASSIPSASACPTSTSTSA